MTLAVALLYLTLAVAGLIAFARGIGMIAAASQLDNRMNHVATSSRLRGGMALPTMLAARGKDRREIIEKLQQAGFQGTDAMDRFLWIRLGATLAALGLAALFCLWMWGGILAKPYVLVLLPALTYLGAKRALVVAAGTRQRAILAEFPFLLDLMLMMLESGISIDQCFRSIARDEATTAPRLNPSIRLLVEDLDRGMSYEAALDRWSQRVAIPSSKDLAALFQQALFQGIELSPALRQFVREFTERRVAAAREAMGRITVKLVGIMVLFFMPALFVVMAGPPLTILFDTMRAAQ